MRKAFLQSVKATFPILAGLISIALSIPVKAQLSVISNKDNTRPEITRQYREQAVAPVAITSVELTKYNGYNEVSWIAGTDPVVKGFTLEYSNNGIDYQVAATASELNGVYIAKHFTTETRPLFYRIRSDRTDGRYTYSTVRALDGIPDAQVTLQSSMISTNVVNAVAKKPVERINVFSNSGMQVYARDVSGKNDFISTTLPSLSKGIYYMTFYGNGWKNTQKFVIL